MPLTSWQTLVMIFAVALGAQLTRVTPFLLFPQNKPLPRMIVYLGRVLPPAMMGLLVVYCFKDAAFFSFPFALPELIAGAAVAALQLWRRNVLLSIGVGTALYMVLVQCVFV